MEVVVAVEMMRVVVVFGRRRAVAAVVEGTVVVDRCVETAPVVGPE